MGIARVAVLQNETKQIQTIQRSGNNTLNCNYRLISFCSLFVKSKVKQRAIRRRPKVVGKQ